MIDTKVGACYKFLSILENSKNMIPLINGDLNFYYNKKIFFCYNKKNKKLLLSDIFVLKYFQLHYTMTERSICQLFDFCIKNRFGLNVEIGFFN